MPRSRDRLGVPHSVVWLLIGLLSAGALSWFSAASLAAMLLALAVTYAGGYVTGSIILEPRHDRTTLSLAVLRLMAGLLLTTIGFLVSLLLSIPWFVGPAVLCVAAVFANGRAAFALPRSTLGFGWDGAAAGLLGVIALAPIVVEAFRMAPGEFPPVFYNVDTGFFLEKVHALAQADMFPPDTLSVVGGRRSYHFGTHALAALLTRTSGVAPHHALFLIVVPLLTAGTLAAAVVAARSISPEVPVWASVALLVVRAPTLWYRFSAEVGPGLYEAVSSFTIGPLDALTRAVDVWGAASNLAQNVGAHFIVLASLAGIAFAPVLGWRLPVFLIGISMIVKTPTGIALAAGFLLAQAYRAVAARSFRPLRPAIAVAVLFGALYGAFWVAPGLPAEFRTVPHPLFHLQKLAERQALTGFLFDVAWILLPAVIVLVARLVDPKERSLPLLVFGVAPFLVVNSLRLVDLRPNGGYQVDDNWMLVMVPVPLILHAFVLSVASQRWKCLHASVRIAFLILIALSVLPPAFVAGRYAYVLVGHPEDGYEFVQNGSIAEALAAIPTEDTIIVTNDLRYPANGFSRDNRQMQISALFGHRAFAVNYAYEAYAFSPERLALQALLRMEEWSEGIEEAARVHGWTHLLVRKDYAHPRSIPLEAIFDGEVYAVYRFAPRDHHG